MYQYQLRQPDDLQPGDRFQYLGRLRTVKSVRRSPGSGWIVTCEDGPAANVVSAQYVLVRTDADPLRDSQYLGLEPQRPLNDHRASSLSPR